MTLAIVGTATASHAGYVTLPAHQVGDLLVVFAAKPGTTQPGKPSAGGTVPTWTDIDSLSDVNASGRSACAVATATDHTSGTWANATDMCAIVLRGQADPPIGGHAAQGQASGGAAIAPALTLAVSDGTSALLSFFYYSNNITSWSAAPTGYTRQAAQVFSNQGSCLNTKNSTTTDGQVTQNLTGGAGVTFGNNVEIKAAVSGEANTMAFFAMF